METANPLLETFGAKTFLFNPNSFIKKNRKKLEESWIWSSMPIEKATTHKVQVVHEVYEILKIQVFHTVNKFHDINKIYERLQNFGAQLVMQGISDLKINSL